MNFDNITQIWQSSENQNVQIQDVDALVRAVIRDHRLADIDRILNITKLVPFVLLAAFLFSHGYLAQPGHPVYDWMTWVYYAFGAITLWIPVFYTSTNIQQRALEKQYGESIRDRLQRTLSQVNHSIWLNKNITWWCILPIAFGFFLLGYRSLHPNAPTRLEPFAWATVMAALVAVLELYAIYWWATRCNITKHFPRKKRLEALLQNLGTEGSTS